MEAKTPRARWQVWISVSAAAGLIFFYLYASRWQFESVTYNNSQPDAKSSDPFFFPASNADQACSGCQRGPYAEAARSEFKLAVSGV